jgi:hypothetical protein
MTIAPPLKALGQQMFREKEITICSKVFEFVKPTHGEKSALLNIGISF